MSEDRRRRRRPGPARERSGATRHCCVVDGAAGRGGAGRADRDPGRCQPPARPRARAAIAQLRRDDPRAHAVGHDRARGGVARAATSSRGDSAARPASIRTNGGWPGDQIDRLDQITARQCRAADRGSISLRRAYARARRRAGADRAQHPLPQERPGARALLPGRAARRRCAQIDRLLDDDHRARTRAAERSAPTSAMASGRRGRTRAPSVLAVFGILLVLGAIALGWADGPARWRERAAARAEADARARARRGAGGRGRRRPPTNCARPGTRRPRRSCARCRRWRRSAS